MMDSFKPQQPLPKAYHCYDFDEYTAGRCTECGTNGERCAILGLRAIEYINSVKNINEGVNSTNSKRFFMITDQHSPLISSK